MQTIQNILIAVDLRHDDRLVDDELSPASAAAIRQGLELAARTQAQVTFCAVLEISAQALEFIHLDQQNIFATVEDFAQKALDRLVAEAKTQGITARTAVRTGSTWQELLAQIQDGKHDLIVVGTRNRSSIARTAFGSTAQRLLRSATCPVWIVKPDEVREIREVLVATDLTEECQQVLHAGVYVARLLNAKLFVVHTLEFPFEPYLHTAGVSPEEIAKRRQQLQHAAQQKLDAQLQQTDCRTLPFGLKAEVLIGAPDDVLPKFVANNQIDVLVIGTHGHQGVSRMILGNTAERLLPHLNASVLTIREG